MIRVHSTTVCCALCDRWKGDAGLTGQGTQLGHLKFNAGVKGNCSYKGPRESDDGKNCLDFQINDEARRYKS